MPGLTDIQISNFTTVAYGEKGSEVEVLHVQSITHPTDEKNIVEVPEFGSIYPRKLVGTSSTGNLEIVVNFYPGETTHKGLLDLYDSGAKSNFLVTINNDDGTASDSYEFSGQVASKTIGGEIDNVLTATFAITIDGAIGPWTPGA